MAGERTIFDDPHHQSLELLAINALAEGDAATAFRLADRRCRIRPQAEPHCFVLRGEASFQLGAKAAAIADITAALELAPDNVSANRRMLAWADGPQQIRAATALIARERDVVFLRKPIEILRAAGQSDFARVSVLEDTVEGWAVWQDPIALEISITDDLETISIFLEADPFHPLGEFGNAKNFSLKRPKSATAQAIALSIAGRIIYLARIAGNVHEPQATVHWPRSKDERAHPVTVVVPVYGDYEATKACLDSLLDELKLSNHRAVIVDDVTPEPRIKKYLGRLAKEKRVSVFTNVRNLGFSGSINRALEEVKDGDVILLNSDTIAPRGFIDRLASAAHSSADIGTLTPLSNNGEFTSFPLPNTVNLLGTREDIETIDKIAAETNGNAVVDIPSGIGFCLYITRACLDAVGGLSDAFGAGYLEDADFCLRARDSGFRNVCATSVYIGHAGSKSFALRKRALVVRNLGILERRYPKHRTECAAFLAADPLKKARAAIERAAAARFAGFKVLLTGSGALSDIAHERARTFEPNKTLILEVGIGAIGATAKITRADGGLPQSLEFNLTSTDEIGALVDFITRLRPSGIEFLDPGRLPAELVEALLGLKVPYDIFIADAGLLGPADVQPRAIPSLDTRPGEKRASLAGVGATAWTNRGIKIAAGARHIFVPCSEAEAFVHRILPGRPIEWVARPAEEPAAKHSKRRRPKHVHFGILPIRAGTQEQRLMRAVAHQLGATRPAVKLTIVGAALDDLDLMRNGKAFVTGAVSAEDFARIVEAYDLQRLFLATPQPLFGHPLQRAALSSFLPVAYFDWSLGRLKPKTGNLAIDPRCTLDELMGSLTTWLPQ